jgi:hypothetical protein
VSATPAALDPVIVSQLSYLDPSRSLRPAFIDRFLLSVRYAG